MVRKHFPLRIIKSTTALYLTLLLAPVFSISVFFAAVGSFTAMRESIILSVKSALERSMGTLIGYIFSLFFSTIFGITPLTISITFFVVFLTIKYFKVMDLYVHSAFMILAMMVQLGESEMYTINATTRLLSINFGILISLLVNIIMFKPPKNQDINHIISEINTESLAYIENPNDKEKLVHLHDMLNLLIRKLAIFKEERTTFITKLIPERIDYLDNLINEIELTTAWINILVQLETLNKATLNSVTPILKDIIILRNNMLNYHNYHKIKVIKKRIKRVYFTNTTDDVFFTNTSFLSNLNIYINLIKSSYINNDNI